MNERVLVTGGSGFIGSAVVRALVGRGLQVLNVDKGTYAADERRLESHRSPTLTTVQMDVLDPAFAETVRTFSPARIVHLAAETHVTRSESGAELFRRTNLEGTRNVLEAALAVDVEHLVHVSTDEVYGPCVRTPFVEEDKRPGDGQATSPYAKSKALADDLALSYADRLRIAVIRPTNCFGPWQHPEKAIARWVTRALLGLRLPVWGDGGQVRDWMFVDDAAEAILLLSSTEAEGVFNAGPEGHQVVNLDIARTVARLVGLEDEYVYLTAYDRPDHDRRYAVASDRLRALGWAARYELNDSLARTVEWYRGHRAWWGSLVEEAESIYSDEEESSEPG